LKNPNEKGSKAK